MEKEIIIFFIGLFSAYFGSFASGGVSALSIGFMVLSGIPPQMAGITFKLGKIGDNLGGILLFHKHGLIPKKFIVGCGIAMFFGSAIGSYFIINIPDFIMYLGCGMSMLLLSIITIFKKESTGHSISKIRTNFGYILHFFISIVGNFFPAGSGIWYYFNNTLTLGMSTLESKGIASISSIFWFVGTLTGIMLAGQYNVSWGISLGFGMFIGGYFGTKHIIKLGDNILKKTLLFSILIFSMYFLYEGIMLL